MNRQYAIIAGSGFQEFAGDAKGDWIETPFGRPSGPVRTLGYAKHAVYFLPRHGDALAIAPHAINYRANLKALRQLGVDSVVAVNTVGVIKAGLRPGQVAVPDQLIDYTSGRSHTIYDDGVHLDHIDFTEPFSEDLRRDLLDAAGRAEVPVHDGGVYAVLQGPRLETAAEIDRLERDGADFVGMTAMPEAALARELGMRYSCLSLIVNYAAGRGDNPIHAELEAGTMAARQQATRILNVFFGATDA